MQNYLPKELFEEYLEAKKKGIFLNVINEKFYRPSDVPLSYRQLNNLDNDNLLPDNRKTKDEWRKFSMKEAIYLYLIAEFKKYGIEHEQLLNLKKAFFKKEFEDIAEASIAMIMRGYQVNIAIIELFGNNEVCFFDGLNFMGTFDNFRSFIFVNLNEIFNDFWEKFSANKKRKDYIHWSEIVLDNSFITSEKEKKLFSELNDNAYQKFIVEKKNGEISMVRKRRNIKDEKTLRECKRNKRFGSLNSIYEDGKIISTSDEDVVKL